MRSTVILPLVATVLIVMQAVPDSMGDALSKNYKTSGNVSFTTVNSNIYLVSMSNNHISIESTLDDYGTCNLEFPNDHIGSIQVAGLQSKILLLYRYNSTSIQILQLDPTLCLYTPLSNSELTVESDSGLQLVVTNDVLEVFVKGGKSCLPCRLDVNGNRLETTGQLEQGNSKLFKSFIVKEFVQQNQSLNYAFAGNFENGSAVLRVLDQNFIIVKQIDFKTHQVEALAAKSGSGKTWIGITYAGLGNPHERILALYTDALELLFETRLQKYQPSYQFINTLLSINSTGHSFVNSIKLNPQSALRYSIYTIYKPSGEFDKQGRINVWKGNINYDWQLLSRNDRFSAAVHQYKFDSTHTCSEEYVISSLNLYF